MKYKKVSTVTGIKFETPLKEVVKCILKSMKDPNPKPIVIVKGRQVGASTLLAAISASTAALSKKPKRLSHLFPQLTDACSYSRTCLNQVFTNATPSKIINRNKDGRKYKSILEEQLQSGGYTNSLEFKKFKNDSFIKVSSAAKIDALHGVRVDVLLLDEAQCMKEYYAKTFECSVIHGGFPVYIITPDDPEHFSKKLWDSSTQNEFKFMCKHCSADFSVNSKNWDKLLTEPDLVKCNYCNFKNNKKSLINKGHFVKTNPDAEMIGFRIPQTIISTIPNESFFSRDNISRSIGAHKRFINESFAEWVDF